MVSTLVFVAHADDETLGCGGTLAHLGGRIHIAVACYGRCHREDQNTLAQLEKAAAVYEATCTIGNWYDQTLDVQPRTELIDWAESAIADYRPARIFTHWRGDRNIDHRVIADAVAVATRRYKGSVYAIEIPGSTELGDVPWQPNVFVPLTEIELGRKLDAMLHYRSELTGARLPDHLRARAMRYGPAVGRAYAEPFTLLRQVGL